MGEIKYTACYGNSPLSSLLTRRGLHQTQLVAYNERRTSARHKESRNRETGRSGALAATATDGPSGRLSRDRAHGAINAPTWGTQMGETQNAKRTSLKRQTSRWWSVEGGPTRGAIRER